MPQMAFSCILSCWEIEITLILSHISNFSDLGTNLEGILVYFHIRFCSFRTLRLEKDPASPGWTTTLMHPQTILLIWFPRTFGVFTDFNLANNPSIFTHLLCFFTHALTSRDNCHVCKCEFHHLMQSEDCQVSLSLS